MEPVNVGMGEVRKYYPISFQIVEEDERTTYYLEDLRAWAEGDLSGIAGMECQVIMGLAQSMLNDLARIEAATTPPEGMRE